MAIRKRKPTSAGRRFQSASDFAEITKTTPERSLVKPKPRTGGRNAYGRMTVAPPRRRPQAPVPRRRLPAEQGRRAGEGRGHRVRPEPQRADRAAPLPRRREALHPRPERRRASATCSRAARARRSVPATRCRCATSRSGPWCTTWSSSRVRAGRWAGARARRSSSSPRRACTPPCACPPPRCGACPIDCRATVGSVGNSEAALISIGKAGRNRWKGKRPHVRGVAMNPVDHPARWWRGQDLGWTPPGVAVGQARGPDPQREARTLDQMIVRRRRSRGSRSGPRRRAA